MIQTSSESKVIAVADGTEMLVYVARPVPGTVRTVSGGRLPAVMVFQEAFGVNGHIRHIADRLAAEGYVTVAPELFHRTAPRKFEGNYADFDSVMPHLSALTVEGMASDIRASYALLKTDAQVDEARIGCLGFCMGGRASFIANATVPLQAAIAYYGARIAPDLLDRAKDQAGPIAFFWGGLDKHIGPEQRRAVADAMTAAGKDFVEVCFAKADHAFSCDERPAYEPKAAAQAWAMSLQFLQDSMP